MNSRLKSSLILGIAAMAAGVSPSMAAEAAQPIRRSYDFDLYAPPPRESSHVKPSHYRPAKASQQKRRIAARRAHPHGF